MLHINQTTHRGKTPQQLKERHRKADTLRNEIQLFIGLHKMGLTEEEIYSFQVRS